MKLAVVGSRDFDPHRTWIMRFEIQKIAIRVGWDDIVIVSGGARGADAAAEQCARDFGVPFEVYPTDWKRYGPRAGMIRNQQIVDVADELLAFFQDGETPGTADAIRRARAKGIPVQVFGLA